ncbi:ferric reductase family protein [Aspergillus homomorphus CBS 101889]|uniref:ferric-chelate reductase (NADPH) n=1 Tax=Aspergillus homomorphus (strain CBS 101889) TaxID=1450537 RepID=A0A395HJG0_ASPHC|nr:putative cell surface metalloreductase [Aspergillus homomorphus CBS 101889]RAL07957.1 putative cell surface metalloreductase [Aspergillus homomorphus CBS 101889]
MDILIIYFIVASIVLASLIFKRLLAFLAQPKGLFSILYFRHIVLPYLVRRHRFCGPWTRAEFILHLLYICVNVFFVFFRMKSWNDSGFRAAELCLINLIFPLSAIHLSYLADILGIKLSTCRCIHRTTGLMAFALLLYHVIMTFRTQGFTFSPREEANLFAIAAAISLVLLVLILVEGVRRWAYEILLRGHQLLAVFFVYSTWRHLTTSTFYRIYLLIASAIFGLLFLLQLITVSYRNGLFARRGPPRALVSFSTKFGEKDQLVVTAIHIRLSLPRPIRVEPGQYINLWMPSVSLWSWTQSHPFTVTSWSIDAQNNLELLVQPCGGLTTNLSRYAPKAMGGSLSFLALFTGPHGLSEDVHGYETVLVLASGFGIATAIPNLKKMIQGYKTSTSQVRRLHLVWQVESGEAINTARALLNDLLGEDIIDRKKEIDLKEDTRLHISIYVQDTQSHEFPLGQHGRVHFYHDIPDYRAIISLEASGDLIKRLSNTWDEPGRTLVMVSATSSLRDHIRKSIQENIYRGVKLSEQEYQPNVGAD